MRQLSFEETELDGEAGFDDVARSGIESSGLIHDESFRVDDLDLNLNEPMDLNVSRIETQSFELIMLNSGKPLLEEVGPQEPIVEEVMVKDYVSSGEDDEHDEENEIIEPDVDVHLFGISMDVPFDCVTNLVLNDVLEGEDVDVINSDGFDSDLGNDNETSNYRRRRLDELSREMKGVMNASGQRKRNLKLYKNDSVKVRARCDGKVHCITLYKVWTTGPKHGMKVGLVDQVASTLGVKKKKTCTIMIIKIRGWGDPSSAAWQEGYHSASPTSSSWTSLTVSWPTLILLRQILNSVLRGTTFYGSTSCRISRTSGSSSRNFCPLSRSNQGHEINDFVLSIASPDYLFSELPPLGPSGGQ
ncbi:hypothetical protein Tco_0782228 [Tanacetum coccineum]